MGLGVLDSYGRLGYGRWMNGNFGDVKYANISSPAIKTSATFLSSFSFGCN